MGLYRQVSDDDDDDDDNNNNNNAVKFVGPFAQL
jgi:hypothetical protein